MCQLFTLAVSISLDHKF